MRLGLYLLNNSCLQIYLYYSLFHIHATGTNRSFVFITIQTERKPIEIEILSRVTSIFLKRKIQKNHSAGKIHFFSPVPRDFPYFIVILGEKKGDKSERSEQRSDGAYLHRSQSLASSSVCKLHKLRSRGVPKDRPIAVDRP